MAYSVVGTNNYMSVKPLLTINGKSKLTMVMIDSVTGRSKFCEVKDMEFTRIGGGEPICLLQFVAIYTDYSVSTTQSWSHHGRSASSNRFRLSLIR